MNQRFPNSEKHRKTCCQATYQEAWVECTRYWKIEFKKFYDDFIG